MLGLTFDGDSVREAALDAERILVLAYIKSSLEHILPEILLAMRGGRIGTTGLGCMPIRIDIHFLVIGDPFLCKSHALLQVFNENDEETSHTAVFTLYQ